VNSEHNLLIVNYSKCTRKLQIIIIIIQHLYSAMESEDTEALGGARLRHVKQMSF